VAERDAAVARIDRRHARIDDPRRSELGTDARDVIDFVLNRGAAGVPRWVAAADHADALVLATWCWWEDRRIERRLLRQGHKLGLSLAELGAPLGIRTRQGVRDRIDRLSALLEHDRPDEQLIRAGRRAAHTRDARQGWIDAHRDEVQTALAAFLTQARRFATSDASTAAEAGEAADVVGEEATNTTAGEWLDELAADYDQDALTPATLAIAGLAAAELRTLQTVRELNPRDRLHGTLREIDLLRARCSGGDEPAKRQKA
jgi:hypothetical protein